MKDIRSLSHTTWDCKYHLVWIPKCRKKVLYGELRKHLGDVFRDLALQRESRILEGHLMGNHLHMLVSIPPKYAVSQVVGYLKGKSAIHIARSYGNRKQNFTGQHFWARGYYVSTYGLDEEVVRAYIRKQEEFDKKIDQLQMFQLFFDSWRGGSPLKPASILDRSLRISKVWCHRMS